jgi:hypothetical protein
MNRMTLAPPDPSTRAALTWRIEWAGRSYSLDDLTVGHLGIVALLVGEDQWEQLSPWQVDPNHGYMMAAYLLTAFLAIERAGDRVLDDDQSAALMAEVLNEVRQIKAVDLADAVHAF